MYKIHNKTYLKKYRRDLRQKQTKAERELWKWIRGSALGYKFCRQHSIQNYIVDFYCPRLRLVLEVDGYIHGEKEKRTHDIERQHTLEAIGCSVLRIRNDQIMYAIESVLIQIRETCKIISRDNPL